MNKMGLICIKCGNQENIRAVWDGASSQGGQAYSMKCSCPDCLFSWQAPSLDSQDLTLQVKKK